MATMTSPAPESTTVYERPIFGLPPMRAYIRGVWERRPFIWEMSRSKLKAEHYNTVLGQVWILLDPFLMAAVYLLLRTVIRPVSAANRWEFIAHLIVGIFFFNYVRKTVNGGSKAITGNKALVLNAAFPRGVLPVEATLRAFLSFLPTLGVYFVLHAVFGLPFGLRALFFLPVLIAILTVFNFGVACLLAPLMVFFRDAEQFIGYFMRIWFFSTPILYTVADLSEPRMASVRSFLIWNPLFPVYAALDQIWKGQVPSPGYLLAATAWALVLLVVGVLVFLVRERDFAVRL